MATCASECELLLLFTCLLNVNKIVYSKSGLFTNNWERIFAYMQGTLLMSQR